MFVFLLGLEEEEAKLVLHLPLHRELDCVRWNPANQDEVSIQQLSLLTVYTHALLFRLLVFNINSMMDLVVIAFFIF